jgi:hypothetical protein
MFVALIVIMIVIHIVVRATMYYRDYRNIQVVVYLSTHHEVYGEIEMYELVYDTLTDDAEAALDAILSSSTEEGKAAAFEMFESVKAGWKSINDQIVLRMVIDHCTRLPLRACDRALIKTRHEAWRKIQRKITRINNYHDILRVTKVYD